jgi:ankyrin repeat protein
MYTNYVALIVFVSSYFSLYSMHNQIQTHHYNALYINQLVPEDIWLHIIAYSKKKGTMREICSYFRDLASTKNEKLFLERLLRLTPDASDIFMLYYADFENNEILNNLLRCGANPNAVDDNKMSVMHYVIMNGNLAMVKTLLEHPQFDAKNIASGEQSPLILAAQCKYMDIIQYIFSHCTIDYEKIICYAIQLEYPEFIALLLPHISKEVKTLDSMRITHPFEERPGRLSALHCAAIKGYVSVAQKLLAHGTDVNLQDSERYTPLHYAITSKSTTLIKLLLEHGASINILNEAGYSPLLCAAAMGNMTRVLFLLHNGADVNIYTHECETALHYASKFGYLKTAQLLLNHTINSNARNDSGATALSYAYLQYHKKIIKLLVNEPSIDLTLDTKNIQLLSEIIQSHRHAYYKDLIESIIEKTDIHAKDRYGNSPFSYTLWHTNWYMFNRLLEQADLKINILYGPEDNKSACYHDRYAYREKGFMTALDIVVFLQENTKDNLQKIHNKLQERGAKTRMQLEQEHNETRPDDRVC